MFEYQKTGRFFAQVAGKMEELGASELKEFGVKEIKPVYRGVWFRTDLEHIYRINYRSRLLTRVLAPLLTFDCHSTNYLLKTASKIEWDELFSVNETFAIFSSVSNSKITHSRYASLVLKDAIVDYFREKFRERPNIDREKPDVWINLHIESNRASISLDCSGGSLHKRGYRVESVPAPMQETLAAAIIRLSGWKGKTTLLDPMCGSGTLLSEALMHYCRIPSAFKRDHFGFEHLPDFEPEKWLRIKADGERLQINLPDNLIFGSDIDKRAVNVSRTNLNSIPNGRNIQIEQRDLREHPGMENATIICNPPYGVRTGDVRELSKLYQELGDFLKTKCKGSTAYIYCGKRELIGSIGLKPNAKIPLMNGNLDGRLVKIEVY
ncbi:MAG TPA: class I SAM-dependent RNA methyltransferase [Candidatus Cloacimonetes bacterium]|nr:class I SAM-dependent RNA methyltransferase [Candidatus Cloacimonadota bacterium]